jgi:hypothetical protein
MIRSSLSRRIGVLAALGWTVSILASQLGAQEPAAQPLDWNATDSAHIALLQTSGRRMAGSQVVVWALPPEMTAGWQAALLDTLNRGVAEMRRMMGAPLSWQRIGNRPIQYYLVPERIISHASGRDIVFISMFHVRGGRAPYLHEAGHELLAPPAPFFYDEYPDTVVAERHFQAMPYWLMEGLPDVLANLAAAAAGTREGDVFAIGGPAQADSTCAARLADNPYRADLLRTLGGRGAVDALFTTDRVKVAPTFYACAQSISKYLVDLIGMPRSVELYPAVKRGDWEATLERAAGMPLESIRSRWQARLGLAGQ